MTTRTVKIFGLAYGATPAEITVTVDGSPIYTGTVSTESTDVPTLPNEDLVNTTVEFCNFEIPMDTNGTIPMTCSVTNGTVIFGQIKANYYAIGNSSVGMGSDNYADINGAYDSRSNVTIDGVPQAINYEAYPYPGTWWFVVNNGSTMTYDLNVIAGTANIANVTP